MGKICNSKLHLNEKRSWKLDNIFVSYLSDLFKWNNDINPTVNVSVNDNDESVSYENEERVLSSISSNIKSEFFGDKLEDLRLSNVDLAIVAQINVNSIRNKFDALMTGIQNKVDILLTSETKPDQTFPTRQFSIEGFISPYRLDRNGSRCGLLAHAREDIPSKLIKT